MITIPGPDEFSGFSPETARFLRTNRQKNGKLWFDAHRNEYEQFVLDPLRKLVCALAPTVHEIDPGIDTTPAVSRTISRIYRDTRFSKDKSLYREDAWLSFKPSGGEDLTMPEFYFYLTPKHYEYGMGFYSAGKEAMDRFRAAVTGGGDRFRQALAAVSREPRFELVKQEYVRILPNAAPPDLQEWFRLKSFCFVCKQAPGGRLFTPELAGEISAGYRMLAPFYLFLMLALTGQDIVANPSGTPGVQGFPVTGR